MKDTTNLRHVEDWNALANEVERLKAENKKLTTALHYVSQTLHALPGGIDTEADIDDRSPEDMVAYVGGIIWQRVQRALKGERL